MTLVFLLACFLGACVTLAAIQLRRKRRLMKEYDDSRTVFGGAFLWSEEISAVMDFHSSGKRSTTVH